MRVKGPGHIHTQLANEKNNEFKDDGNRCVLTQFIEIECSYKTTTNRLMMTKVSDINDNVLEEHFV